MASANDVARARRDGVLFGIPLGDLGWFASLLMGVATGMAAFFLTTFVAIVAMLIYMEAKHHAVDFALTYKRAGFPVGVVVMACALSYLGVQWARRMARKYGKSQHA
jgi:ABC-type dipeptide/oligopeptide/nickel transport system permease subunit